MKILGFTAGGGRGEGEHMGEGGVTRNNAGKLRRLNGNVGEFRVLECQRSAKWGVGGLLNHPQF